MECLFALWEADCDPQGRNNGRNNWSCDGFDTKYNDGGGGTLPHQTSEIKQEQSKVYHINRFSITSALSF